MSDTEPVHMSVGDPTSIDLCPDCLLPALHTLPLTGITESGVRAMGSITICDDCGSPQKVVADYRARIEGGSTT